MRALVLGLLMIVPAVSFARPGHVVVGPPHPHHPGVVVGAPGVRVRVAPPAARVEVRTRAPSPRHVWVPGYWGWRGGRHVWIGGFWRMPPQPGHVWIEGRWVDSGGEWVWEEGRWAAQPQVVVQPPQPVVVAPPQPVVVVSAPPPPRVEVRTAAPYTNAVWVGGHWQWNGTQHVWVPGHWQQQQPGRVWVDARWEAGPGGFRFVAGHWE